MKLLSIAVPCYNSQDYMEKCIQTLLVGGDEVEILIVDDGYEILELAKTGITGLSRGIEDVTFLD